MLTEEEKYKRRVEGVKGEIFKVKRVKSAFGAARQDEKKKEKRRSISIPKKATVKKKGGCARYCI